VLYNVTHINYKQLNMSQIKPLVIQKLPTIEEFKNSLPSTFSYNSSCWPWSQRSEFLSENSGTVEVIDGYLIKKIEYKANLSYLSFWPFSSHEVEYSFNEVNIQRNVQYFIKDIKPGIVDGSEVDDLLSGTINLPEVDYQL